MRGLPSIGPAIATNDLLREMRRRRRALRRLATEYGESSAHLDWKSNEEWADESIGGARNKEDASSSGQSTACTRRAKKRRRDQMRKERLRKKREGPMILGRGGGGSATASGG